MQIGERIKKIREFRNLSQKELGIAVGFPEKSASARFTQYEIGSRIPKLETINILCKVLKCNPSNLKPMTELGLAENTMMDLFWLEERLNGSMQIFQLEKYSNEDDARVVFGNYNVYNYNAIYPPVAIAINYDLINNFMREWAFRFKELSEKAITHEEYFEWKLNFPQTCDDCGRFEPTYSWKKCNQNTQKGGER